jgi:hypothetical protein
MDSTRLRSGVKAAVVVLIVVVVIVGYTYPQSITDENAAQTADIEHSERLVFLNNTTHSVEFLIVLDESDRAEIRVEERTGSIYTQYNVTQQKQRLRVVSLSPGDTVCAVYMNDSGQIDRDCLPKQSQSPRTENTTPSFVGT